MEMSEGVRGQGDRALTPAAHLALAAYPESRPVPAQDITQSLTVEVGLYGLLALLGLAMRIWDLGALPLSRSEAEVAHQAWLTYRGLGGSPIGHSPLLFNILQLLYWVFGSSDTAVRLVPALAGSGLVILPALLRSELGRWGALFAAAYAALSPSLVFFSRQASGESLALLGTLALLAAAWRYANHRQPGELYLAAGALAVALLSGPAIYLSLSIWAIWLAGLVLIRRLRGERGIGAECPDHAGMQGIGFDLQLGEVHRRALILLAGMLVLLSTGALAVPAGLQAALELIPSSLSAEVGPGPLELLLTYEPAAFLLGLIGLGMSLARRPPQAGSLLMSLWFVAGTALYSLALGGASATPHLLLPLMLLSALPVEWVLSRLGSEEFWLREGLFVLLSTLAWVFLLFQGARYSLFEELGSLVLGAVALGFLLSLFALFGVWKGWARAARAFLLFLLIALGGLTVRASWMLNQTWDPSLGELLRPVATSPDVRQLLTDLEMASNLRTGQRHALKIAVGVDDPRLRWYMREFENVGFGQASASPATITELGQEPGSAGYLGQRYRLEYAWGPLDGGWADWARWYLYRQAPVRPQGCDVMLWLLRSSAGQ